MAREYDFAVSLKIRHPSIDPDEITRTLKLIPQHAWKAGADRPATAERSSAGTYRETLWIAPLGPSPYAPQGLEFSLDEALRFGALQVQRSRPFWNRLVAEGGSAELLIEIFGAETFTLELTPATFALLARSKLAISVQVHSGIRSRAVA